MMYDSPEFINKINELWSEGNYTEFYAHASVGFNIYVIKTLIKEYNLDYQEAEDCVSDVFEALLKLQDKDGTKINDIYRYFFKCARNSAKSFLTRKKKATKIPNLSSDDKSPAKTQANYTEVALNPEIAVSLTGELLEEYEPDEVWVLPAINLAIANLTNKEQLVIKHLLSCDDMNTRSSCLPDEIGMSPSVFRIHKSSAFRKLEDEIRSAIIELRLIPPQRVYESIFEEDYWHGPSDE